MVSAVLQTYNERQTIMEYPKSTEPTYRDGERAQYFEDVE
jgi:hypothetical protein